MFYDASYEFFSYIFIIYNYTLTSKTWENGCLKPGKAKALFITWLKDRNEIGMVFVLASI